MFNPVLLPDVVTHKEAETPLPLQWVGMEGIAIPLVLTSGQGGRVTLSATADIFVSLDEVASKGIHMSRLHLLLNKLADSPIDQIELEAILDQMIESQTGVSRSAKIKLAFDFVLRKSSLLSNEQGYQSYPVVLCLQKVDGVFSVVLELTVAYSSTCPCSASLSQHSYSNAIDKQFNSPTIDKAQLLAWIESERGSVATPHSQRSFAYLKMVLSDFSFSLIPTLIQKFEEIIGTPVQTAVKRQDEQEFAKLNGENLMFCEDAARKIKSGLEQMTFVKDYWFKVEHQESLHAHNAVVVDQKYTERPKRY